MCGVCVAWALSPHPANAAPKRAPAQAVPAANAPGAPGDWANAQVITDGAAIYTKPDFDSPVQEYVNFQTKVVITKRPTAGQGGMGLFHRVRYQNKYGYIPDTDIRASKGGVTDEVAAKPKKKSPDKAFEDPEKDFHKDKHSVYLTRFIGPALSMVQFTEKFSGHKLSDHMLMYGLRMMGPGTLFDGPPLDLNIWASFQKPAYYSKFASPPSGFLLFGDLGIMLPLVDSAKTLFSYGLGFMWTYTRYAVPVKSANTGVVATFDSQEVRGGVDFTLGLGHRFGHTQLRADAKYFIEKTTYAGYLVSFLWEY